jgi:hypothetical protein
MYSAGYSVCRQPTRRVAHFWRLLLQDTIRPGLFARLARITGSPPLHVASLFPTLAPLTSALLDAGLTLQANAILRCLFLVG